MSVFKTRPLLYVEIILLQNSNISQKEIEDVIKNYLNTIEIEQNCVLDSFNKIEHPILYEDVKAVVIGEIPNYDQRYVNLKDVDLIFYVYKTNSYGPVVQTEENDEEELNIATHLILPSENLINLWENLYYENDVKENLLKYAKAMMEFSNRGIDSNVINSNRVILLHGPPGTGKTSLCKALAQKLTVRMQDEYKSGLLIEINSHSLFSKWFSESGKLVTKLFTKILEIVENRSILVCVLIDEVESLAHARKQCLSGNDPSDSVRVVNAVLTQIDQIQRHPNVLILTTSNMTEAIDFALVDRADIKQFLGLPSEKAIYRVYISCLQELFKKGVISDKVNGTLAASSDDLMRLCRKSVGLSGRTLRKIPFIAFALYINSQATSLSEFLDAMVKAVEQEQTERAHFNY